ncbi:MAG TPA: cobalt ECF transporter T component CbiQ [Planctomycetota bacterium]|nr:cobalt ECF transporter T component CbiQ [Planctomycetota bacterium]
MHHAYVDQLSAMSSPVHRLDPRTKIICTLAFCGIVVSVPADRLALLAWCVPPLCAALAVSRLPLLYFLKRCLLLSPFVATVLVFFPFTQHSGTEVARVGPLHVYSGGLLMSAVLAARFLCTVLAALILACTTPFAALLRGLEKFRVPRLFIMVLSFLYRYLFVLVDESDRMRRARDSRSPRPGGAGALRAAPGMIGMLFIRTYDRSERVYSAMLARGFHGTVRTLDELHFHAADAAVLAGFAAYFIAVFIVAR